MSPVPSTDSDHFAQARALLIDEIKRELAETRVYLGAEPLDPRVLDAIVRVLRATGHA
ncbi:MAG: hypothetical protein ACOC26_03510 [Halochromatium sp.]